MAFVLASQEEFERNYKEHLQYFKDRHDPVNGSIALDYVDCSAEGRWLCVSHVVTEAEGNPNGVIHGGITAWLIDTAMGMLNLSLLGRGITPTVNMSVNYLEGIPVGAEITLRSHIDRFGRHIVFDSCEVWWDGKLAATALGSYIRVEPPVAP